MHPVSLPTPTRSERFRQSPALWAGVFAIVLYAITIGGDYVYDDIPAIRLDERIRDPRQWGKLWTTDYGNGGVDNLYRPLTSMSYAVEMWLHGDRPWAFHLVNILLHAMASAGVAEVGRRLAGRRVGWIGGMLFAAHPIHVEAVANIVGRAELGCTAAIAGALILCMTRRMTMRRVWGIVACTWIAILTKEQGLLLPFLMGALVMCRKWGRDNESIEFGPGTVRLPESEVAPAARVVDHEHPSRFDTSESHREREAWRWLLVLICFTFAINVVARETFLHLKFYWERAFLDSTLNPIIDSAGIDRWLIPLALLGRYFQLLILPFKLSPDYGQRVIGFTIDWRDPYLYIGAIALLIWIGQALFAWRKRRGAMLFCLIGLALSYGLVSNSVMVIGTIFGERLMYLPSAFFVILIAMGLSRMRASRVRIGVIAGILALASLRTVTYAGRWNDKLKFYEICLKEQPRSIQLHKLVADERRLRGDVVGAEEVAARGRELMPNYWDIYLISGQIALDAGRFDDADAFYNKAMRLRPTIAFRVLAARQIMAERKAAAATQVAPASTTLPITNAK